MRILVTGAAGFIGSHLAEALLARGDRVTGLDNFDPFYDRSIKEGNLAGLRETPGFHFLEGDIRSAGDLDRAFGADPEGVPEVVVHLAALAGVRPSVENPLRYQEVNLGGTAQVLEAMRRHGTGRLVFGSSSSVYGNNEKVPFAETDAVDYPISPYAATKRAGELLCHAWAHLFDFRVTCLRFFTVYGPRQRPDLAIHKFARMILAGETLPLYGDGSSRRDYTYIDDILQGVIAAIDRPVPFRIYNLGESRTTELRELVRLLGDALGVTPAVAHKPMQPGDVRQTFADVTRASEELDYRPSVPVAEGIPRFVRWLREEAPAAPARTG